MMAATGGDHEPDLVARQRAGRAFVAITVAASIPAFRFGFELGAFDNIAYQWFFSIWVLATVTLAGSLILRDEFRPGWTGVVALLIPSIVLAAHLIFPERATWVAAILGLASLATLPLSLYILARMLVGDFFVMGRRLQVWAMVILAGVASVGLVVGEANDRVLRCQDFELVGEYQPDDCRP